MRAASYAERVIDLPLASRAAMVVLGWIPAAHALAAAAPLVVAIGRDDWSIAIWSVPILYLLPPVAVRLTAAAWPLPSGRVELASAAFLRWWASSQWQILFARLPWLEEALRLVPGLYSMWLRLWGARIGSLVYWSPGVVILDRPLVRVGARVAFGAGVRVAPHVIAPDDTNRGVLVVAPISIGCDALVGAYSTLLPGCEIADGEATPPFRSIHPFSRLERGRRTRVAATAPGATVDVE